MRKEVEYGIEICDQENCTLPFSLWEVCVWTAPANSQWDTRKGSSDVYRKKFMNGMKEGRVRRTQWVANAVGWEERVGDGEGEGGGV